MKTSPSSPNKPVAMAAAKQLLHSSRAALHVPFFSSSSPPLNFNSQVFRTQKCVHCTKLSTTSTRPILSIAPNRASSQSDGVIEADIDGGGVPLGTMKLPLDTDVDRFETLLFQDPFGENDWFCKYCSTWDAHQNSH